MLPEDKINPPPDIESYLDPPSLRKIVRGADKLKGVQPEVLNHWNNLQGEFDKAGLTPEIKSGFRTTAQQQSLYNNPATRARTKGNDGIVNISPHQEGRALDISFPSAQKAKGHQIIASYAQQNGLQVPSDEPWHISLPKQGQKPSVESYLDPVETQQPTQQAKPDVESYLDPVTQQPAQPALKTPKVTVGISEGAVDESQKLEPIQFRQATDSESNLSPVAKSAQRASENVRLQGLQLPANHPDLLGTHVEAKFDHKPTMEEADNALMEQIGKGYGGLAQRFRDETGTSFTGGQAEIKQNADGSYSAHGRPTQGFIQAVNAYATGGRKAYENALSAQTTGRAAVARDVQAELKKGEGVGQDLYQAANRAALKNTQFLQNAADLVKGQDPETEKNARAIAESEQNIPSQKTWTGTAADVGLGTAGTIMRAEATGGGAAFPLEQELENAQRSPSEMYKAGILAAPIVALGPIGRAAETNAADLGLPLSPAGRQVALRTGAAVGLGGGAAATGGSPKEILGAAIQGGAFPTGQREAPERARDLGIDRAPIVPDIEKTLAAREESVKPAFLRDDQGNPVARVLNPEEVAQGAKPKIRPIHQSDTQARSEIGRFTPAEPAAIAPAVEPPNEAALPATASLPNVDESAPTKQAQIVERGFTFIPDGNTPPSDVTGLSTEPVEGGVVYYDPARIDATTIRNTSTQELLGHLEEKSPTTTSAVVARNADGTEVQSSAVTPGNEVAQVAETQSRLPNTEVGVEPPEKVIAERLAAEPSTTSARKDQLAVDRAELDLPELSQPERKGWRDSLTNAKEKGLDQKAERLADQILKNPRALDDEQTAGMVLRLQQLKNEHADLLKNIDAEIDPEKLAQHRADLEGVEKSFDNITEAVRKSGTEKGRSLASQKLTINQDFDLVSMLNRYKAKTGKEPTPEVRAQIETQQKRIADLEKQLSEKSTNGVVDKIAREVRRENRQRTKKVLDDEAATIKSNIAAEFMRLKSQVGKQTTLSQQGLGLLDPDGVITKNALKYAKNRFESGVITAEGLVDEVHGLLKDFVDGVTKRQVAEMLSGYNRLPGVDKRSELTKQLADLKTEMRQSLHQADIEAGTITAKRQGPRETKAAIQSRFQKQINEIERRIREQDFKPKAKRGPTVLDSETQKIQVNLERAKQDFQRQLRGWQDSQRSRTEKVADLTVQWGRAAKLMYLSTLGKLGSAATGRVIMSPIENLVGEIPHRLSPELSRKATTEGGGFDRAAEVAALWKSGRFRAMLDQVTKGGSDLDVLFGGAKSIDKEMSSGGVLGVPGRIHGALKEYPRQAEFDRAFIKVLKNYDRAGRDITEPSVQLAARMEAFNSAERARFQQRNFVSDTFNDAMSALERKGIAGKAASKVGRFIFPITRVPVNVVGETLNYTLGIPRAAVETAIRGGVKNLTPEQANNIMRAYKKGGVGLAMMTYAFLNPQQFGGYYQKGDKRDPSGPQPGEIMFFGHRIPKVLTHVPILEAGQLAATARRVMDSMADQGKGEAILGGGLAATKGLAEQIPFYETPARFFTGKEGSRGVAQVGGELVRGTIPGFIQEAAKAGDRTESGDTNKRVPSGSFGERFKQTVEMGIPGLRQTVPINSVFGSKATKASSEAQRLGMTMNGIVRQPDEKPQEFAQRQSFVNNYVRRAVEKTVTMPDYQKDSDANKLERLKQAQRAAQAEGETEWNDTHEKPEKPEKIEYPRPSGAPQAKVQWFREPKKNVSPQWYRA